MPWHKLFHPHIFMCQEELCYQRGHSSPSISFILILLSLFILLSCMALLAACEAPHTVDFCSPPWVVIFIMFTALIFLMFFKKTWKPKIWSRTVQLIFSPAHPHKHQNTLKPLPSWSHIDYALNSLMLLVIYFPFFVNRQTYSLQYDIDHSKRFKAGSGSILRATWEMWEILLTC